MKVFLYIAAAVSGYIVAGINPAILMSKAIYKKDIRECGSGNPGFTNFKRTFGNRWAWWVFVLDIAKTAVVVGLFAGLFAKQGMDFSFGAAYTGIFCMIGNAFPILFQFHGGKGFLVCLCTMFMIDWRVGGIAAVVLCILLLITKYMSLSTVISMLLCPILLILFDASIPVVAMAAVCALFMAGRHKANFKRLLAGTESKFSLRGNKEQKNSTKERT